MDAQFFIYTRGHLAENDYTLMFAPSEDFCPSDTRQYFRQQVRGSINIEMYEGTLMSPRWLFSRHGGFVLWGMAIMNSVISNVNNTDYTGRGVRGFFGMVFKDEKCVELPIALDFYKSIYGELVSPRWYNGKEDFKQIGIAVDEEFGTEVIKPCNDDLIAINYDPERTVIWGDGHSEIEYLSAALATNKETSFITGLSELAHAYDHKYFFMNALVLGVSVYEEKHHSRSHDEKSEEDKVKGGSEIKKPVVPKKVSRPKMQLPRVIAVILMLAIVGMCFKGTKKSKHSTSSGEKTQMEQSEDTHNKTMDSEVERTK